MKKTEFKKEERYHHDGLGTVTLFFGLLTAGFILFNVFLAIFYSA